MTQALGSVAPPSWW